VVLSMRRYDTIIYQCPPRLPGVTALVPQSRDLASYNPLSRVKEREVVSVHRKYLGAKNDGIRAKRDCRGISDNGHLKEAAVCLRRTLYGF